MRIVLMLRIAAVKAATLTDITETMRFNGKVVRRQIASTAHR